MEFKPSKYQSEIFEFVKYGYGNAVISAVAGSGKSTTIIKALDYIKPEKKVLFLAFNNLIVESLKTKITRDNTDIKTLHSLGYSILKYNFKNINIEVNENKYHNKLLNYLNETESTNINNIEYIKNILKICNLGRFFLVKNNKDLLTIVNKYGVVLIDDEINVVEYLIDWGRNSLNDTKCVDYTDMIYLPNVLNVKVFKYDFIIIDEAQDLSISQMSLFMKCFKQGSRFIAVGDDKQCINAFAGSDIESFNKLKKLSNTIELPLSICYRCPRNIINHVKKINPDIEPSVNAIDGFINFNANIDDLKSGDMVICRNTLPLIKLYIKLIDNGIKSFLKGKDIGLNLIDLIENINIENINNLFNELNEYLIKFIRQTENNDIYNTQSYNDLNEKVECLKIIAKNLKSKTELISKINEIFSNDDNDGVMLSTIHKAKGLEADNVYILNNNLIPSKYAKQNWEIEQERNLEYVALTRSKCILGFIYDK